MWCFLHGPDDKATTSEDSERLESLMADSNLIKLMVCRRIELSYDYSYINHIKTTARITCFFAV